MATTSCVYLNGSFLKGHEAAISVDDRGFLFADALYDVARAVHAPGAPGGVMLFTEALHWGRLRNGMAAMHLGEGSGGPDVDDAGRPLTARGILDALPGIARELIKRNGLCGAPGSTALVYVQVTRGAAPRAHAFPAPGSVPPTLYACAKAYVPAAGVRATGVSATVAADTRWARCGIKTVGLLANCEANTAATASGAYEALLLRPRWGAEPVRPRAAAPAGAPLAQFGQPNGPVFAPEDLHVVEASHSNVWAVVDRGGGAFALITHPLDNVLPGISRAVILARFAASRHCADAARELGGVLSVCEESWTLDGIYSGRVQEIIVTSSGLDAVSITRVLVGSEFRSSDAVEAVTIGTGSPGPTARALTSAFAEWLAEDVATACSAAQAAAAVAEPATPLPVPGSYFAVIVGAGLSGAVLARELAGPGRRVLVLDKRDHIGGNVFDEIEPESGLRVSRYGAHLFHTNDEGVWEYVSRFAHWTRWDHRVVTRVGSRLVPVPANINTVNALFDAHIADEAGMRAWMARERVGKEADARNSEEVALARVGQRLYTALFDAYTRKQWGCSAADLDPLVLQRIPVRDSFDDRYFSDKYQALPTHGYTALVEAILASPHIDVRLRTDFFAERAAWEAAGAWVLYTGPVDSFFPDAGLPRLEYRSIEFSKAVLTCAGYAQPNSVVNFADADTPLTRTIEYKHFLNQTSPSGKTVLVSERPCDEGEPYYPKPTQANKDVYARYQALAAAAERDARSPRVRFVGRLAQYKYINMDAAVRGGLDAAAEVMRASGIDVTGSK